MGSAQGIVAPTGIYSTPSPVDLPMEEREDRDTVRARMEAKRAGERSRSPFAGLDVPSLRKAEHARVDEARDEAVFVSPPLVELEPEPDGVIEPPTAPTGRGHRRYGDDVVAAVARLYGEGLSQSQIAERLAIPAGSMTNLMRRGGIEPRPLSEAIRLSHESRRPDVADMVRANPPIGGGHPVDVAVIDEVLAESDPLAVELTPDVDLDEPVPYLPADPEPAVATVRAAATVADSVTAILDDLADVLDDHQAAADAVTHSELRYAIARIRQHTDTMRSHARAVTVLTEGIDL